MQPAFERAKEVEHRAMEDLLPFLKDHSFEGRFVLTHQGPLSQFLQKTVGDVILNSSPDKVWSVELKAEEDCRTGNFFLETWSNRRRFTPGWMFTLQADFLFYYFVGPKALYVVQLPRLKQWAFVQEGRSGHPGRLWDFPEKPQAKYDQPNDTWGRCVPILTLREEMGFSAYNLEGGEQVIRDSDVVAQEKGF
jgi:hypothetical protein